MWPCAEGWAAAAQWVDCLALAGDKSDGVVGLDGIGEMSATRLLQAFGSIQGLHENAHRVRPAPPPSAGRLHALLAIGNDLTSSGCALLSSAAQCAPGTALPGSVQPPQLISVCPRSAVLCSVPCARLGTTTQLRACSCSRARPRVSSSPACQPRSSSSCRSQRHTTSSAWGALCAPSAPTCTRPSDAAPPSGAAAIPSSCQACLAGAACLCTISRVWFAGRPASP